MKRTLAAMLLAGMASLGIVGCTDTSTAKQETTISTPNGSTKITTEKTIEKTGDNPPPAAP